MVFQVLLSLLIFIAIVRLFIQLRKKHINLFFFFFFLIIWSLVMFFNWNNILLNKIGKILGVERGVDILVYTALFLLFYYVFVSIIRFYKLEHEINMLVKRDAIRDFEERYNINDNKTVRK